MPCARNPHEVNSPGTVAGDHDLADYQDHKEKDVNSGEKITISQETPKARTTGSLIGKSIRVAYC